MQEGVNYLMRKAEVLAKEASSIFIQESGCSLVLPFSSK